MPSLPLMTRDARHARRRHTGSGRCPLNGRAAVACFPVAKVGVQAMGRERGLVLLIEDDDDLREAEVDILEGAGFRVVAARDGREALELVAREMPMVIFLDMRMPGMDGWTFAREFRAR